ncbi:MAG TPA: HD domain-containing protein [Streptosporangiaceae bacterium]|jgi:hypothetical protein|nr:HD domain-containing protein [Streptosporangiaceae bacterium]
MKYPQPGAREDDLIADLREVVLTIRPGADVELIGRAYVVAAHFHEGQRRLSGHPYITHPVTVATILAGLAADDQMLAAAILHDTVDDTPYTRAELRHDFGDGVATMVDGLVALDHISGLPGRKVARAMAAITSTDTRVVALKVADRLHNMRTLQFVPQAKQLRKAREVLDIIVPVARQLSMGTVGMELQSLAFGALIRNRSSSETHQRAIVALDIENSTSRPDPVKAELRIMLYELFDSALRSAGIHRPHRDPFYDRGDGLLALIHRVERAGEVLVIVVPVLTRLLTDYNASLPRQRQLRVRVVVHAGDVRYDADGCFGTALDIAFRLLDAPSVKEALTTAPGPLLAVVSEGIYGSVVEHGYGGIERGTYHRVSSEIAGIRLPGWIHAG